MTPPQDLVQDRPAVQSIVGSRLALREINSATDCLYDASDALAIPDRNLFNRHEVESDLRVSRLHLDDAFQRILHAINEIQREMHLNASFRL